LAFTAQADAKQTVATTIKVIVRLAEATSIGPISHERGDIVELARGEIDRHGPYDRPPRRSTKEPRDPVESSTTASGLLHHVHLRVVVAVGDEDARSSGRCGKPSFHS
jgi:hypothetical protein